MFVSNITKKTRRSSSLLNLNKLLFAPFVERYSSLEITNKQTNKGLGSITDGEVKTNTYTESAWFFNKML